MNSIGSGCLVLDHPDDGSVPGNLNGDTFVGKGFRDFATDGRRAAQFGVEVDIGEGDPFPEHEPWKGRGV